MVSFSSHYWHFSSLYERKLSDSFLHLNSLFYIFLHNVSTLFTFWLHEPDSVFCFVFFIERLGSRAQTFSDCWDNVAIQIHRGWRNKELYQYKIKVKEQPCLTGQLEFKELWQIQTPHLACSAQRVPPLRSFVVSLLFYRLYVAAWEDEPLPLRHFHWPEHVCLSAGPGGLPGVCRKVSTHVPRATHGLRQQREVFSLAQGRPE